MAKGIYIGASNTAKKVKKEYVGVGGVAKKVKKVYIGDANGKARLAWTGSVPAGQVVFTASQTWIVPDGVTKIDIFCVGGGGGQGGTHDWQEISGTTNYGYLASGAYGGGGYTSTALNMTVTPNETLSVIVGAGGVKGADKTYLYYYGTVTETGPDVAVGQKLPSGTAGGSSSVMRSNTALCSANGGDGGLGGVCGRASYIGSTSAFSNGANGGSSSGAIVASGYRVTNNGQNYQEYTVDRGTAGSDGGDGGRATLRAYLNGSLRNTYTVGYGGTGQGTTTKAFGEAGGTLYSTGEPVSGMYGSSGNQGVVVIRWAEQEA